MQRTPEVERLQEHGCSVLCLDCPEGMLFGIDYAAFTIGPRFMGVKLVPPGLHYIYTSGNGEDVGVSRTGFFLHMRPQEVAVFRWDASVEELVRPDNLDEEARYADGVRGFDFDQHLGPYPLDLTSQWSELTRYATAQLVAKIEPVGKVVRSKRAEYDAISAAKMASQEAAEAEAKAHLGEENREHVGEEAKAEDAAMTAGQGILDSEPGQDTPDSRAERATDSRLESNHGAGTLFFSNLPRTRKRKGQTPMETTSMHFDRSDQLDEMLRKEYNGDDTGILGELQIAYIAFILGQNYDGFEQWRALLLLLCSCEVAVRRKPSLFAELCRTFFAQLSQAPADLFGDDLTKENFMGSCALSLIDICDADGLPPKLRSRCGKLKELVEQKFGISVEDLALLGEDAPQIVDFEDGRDLIDLGSTNFNDMD